MGYMKQIMAYALQGALLVLLMGLIPILTANDYLSFASFDGGIWANASAFVLNIMTYCALILKYVAVIILLVGSRICQTISRSDVKWRLVQNFIKIYQK